MDIETYNKSTEFKIMFNSIFQNFREEAINDAITGLNLHTKPAHYEAIQIK
jgi:hypothetical protein